MRKIQSKKEAEYILKALSQIYPLLGNNERWIIPTSSKEDIAKFVDFLGGHISIGDGKSLKLDIEISTRPCGYTFAFVPPRGLFMRRFLSSNFPQEVKVVKYFDDVDDFIYECNVYMQGNPIIPLRQQKTIRQGGTA